MESETEHNGRQRGKPGKSAGTGQNRRLHGSMAHATRPADLLDHRHLHERPCRPLPDGRPEKPNTYGDGRGERIRTSDSCVPNAVLYQAELHPEDDGPAETKLWRPCHKALKNQAQLQGQTTRPNHVSIDGTMARLRAADMVARRYREGTGESCYCVRDTAKEAKCSRLSR
jgi:hypothetical protein